MNLLALDLSLSATGYASSTGLIGTIKSEYTGTMRVVDIVHQIMDYEDKEFFDDTHVVMEDLPFGSGNKAAGALGMLHGALRYVLCTQTIPFTAIPPASLKKYATGKGNATKPDMRMAMYQRVGLDLRDDNQVDAWWLLAMAHDHFGSAIVAMPQSHRVALEKVEWG